MERVQIEGADGLTGPVMRIFAVFITIMSVVSFSPCSLRRRGRVTGCLHTSAALQTEPLWT